MSTLLLFGVSASKGTGYQVLLAAKQKKGDSPFRRCVALVRQADFAAQIQQQGVEVVVGDALNRAQVAAACQLAGTDTVIVSTLGGPHANYEAQRIIIDEAESAGIKKMLLVTSLGCGDSWLTLSEQAKKAFGYAVREKSLAEVWLQTSQLNYCILRPGGLHDGAPTGKGAYYYQQEVHGYLNRSDLAAMIIDKITQPQLENSIYCVIDPTLVIERNYRG